MISLKAALAAGAGAAALAGAAHAQDFGAQVEQLLHAQSQRLFGFSAPLPQSANVDIPRAGATTPLDVIDLAQGLKARFLTRKAANDADMFSFYPLNKPTHVIFCIENGRAADASGKPINPSIQAINLKTGAVTDVAYGMNRCDGIRTTAWNTVLATEETDDGGAYELLNPLSDDTFYVVNRGAPGASAVIVDQNGVDATDRMTKRPALAALAWEGLEALDNGVVIFGDELRPGTGTSDKDGGALFKFVPATPRLTDGPIASLSQSPLVAGQNYAMQVSCTTGAQFGQGCEIGNAAWIAVSAAFARDDADRLGATGYYRPEDLHLDPTYRGQGQSARFCWANTGNESAQNYAEVICGVDTALLTASANQRSVAVNRFVEGDADFNSFDNLAFQPKTGNLYVVEDHPNGDVFACLPDGADRDIKTDGCVRVLSVRDRSAEPTGFEFSKDGRTAILAIQHSSPDALGDTDDIILIEGFKVK
ncbi:MAG TPA: DUF839 domain-containing protein [Parvularculaceae bacterium]|nr:DUF839 domain-containing protein [Parvularculaceae bacterium]